MNNIYPTWPNFDYFGHPPNWLLSLSEPIRAIWIHLDSFGAVLSFLKLFFLITLTQLDPHFDNFGRPLINLWAFGSHLEQFRAI